MNLGLVLSGGGVRGAAHIGAIKALEEFSIHPTHIAGTSAGAIVGALYAYGYSCKEMNSFFKKVQILDFKKYARNKPGFIDSEKYYSIFTEYFPIDDFSILKKKLTITATDILEGTLKAFSRGELIKPIIASATFPGLFAPIKINDSYYIDGGTLNNFPVELVSDSCDTIIG
ncbi:MAG: patatin-like phospholipase family protein, partial [Bacteroidia bacterium]|nr:patatin-like phospholipase family protein [Bacteroidia bacterium]